MMQIGAHEAEQTNKTFLSQHKPATLSKRVFFAYNFSSVHVVLFASMLVSFITLFPLHSDSGEMQSF